jgi:enediyne biosynthesis protein E4
MRLIHPSYRKFLGPFLLTKHLYTIVILSFIVVTVEFLPQLSATRPSQREVPTFTDITKIASLEYRITCGDEINEYLIDINGQGACFIDYDNDGYQDLYLVNGSSRKMQATGRLPHDYLLRNMGDGRFKDVTEMARLGDTAWSSGCAVGDYNNDGYLDLYITNYGPNKLYRNDGNGTFTEVGESAGVAGPRWDPPKWSMGAAFADYDNDGYVDLYVTNFVKFDLKNPPPPPTEASPCKLKGVPIACPPDIFEAQQDLLYRNNGDGTFSDVSNSAGIVGKDAGKGFAVLFSDFDNDGDQDIYVANDAGPNFYYVNEGSGKFKDASWISGTAVDEQGNPQGSMGLTGGDYNNDGLMDIFVTNFIEQTNTLYHNRGSNSFMDRTTATGLGLVGFHYSGWGTKFFDFDNDSWLDLFITNGHTNDQLEQSYPTDSLHAYAEPNYLMRNVDGRQYVEISEAVGIRKLPNRVGRGTTFGDFDNDGDIDLLIVNKNDIPLLLRNDGGNAKNWIVLRTEGTKSNRSGIGARVSVNTGSLRRIFEVRGSDSYLSSNDLRVHVGLGSENWADVEIRWPSGHIDRGSRVSANKFYLAREGSALREDPYSRPKMQPGR